MATKGYVESVLNALEPRIKTPLVTAFNYVLDNWRLGDTKRAQNAQWYRFTVTTPAVAQTEFSIHHGQGEKPSLLIPVLDLNAINSQLVPLSVSRAPDTQRAYFKSSSTSAALTAYLEF